MIGAVDIGGTKIAVGIVDSNGRVLAQAQRPTEGHNYSHGFDAIVRMLGGISAQVGVTVSGIGIGATGPVDPIRGEFGDVDFLPGWRGKNLVRDLERSFSVRAAMENDGDAAALAEAGWGAGRNRTRLIYVTVGTGIGGGIILDGKLYRGVDGAHPEIGHHVVDPSGPDCSCGFRGCWESLAAGPAMVAWLERHAPLGYLHRQGITAKRICELAQQGDELAKQAVEHEGYYLGLGLANLISMFTPDAIVLSGSVMKSAPLFMDRIREVIRRGCRFVPAEKTELMLASLGDDTNLIGAARVWHNRFS
ncbi:MAG TPA: ROK family protein [Candidatus Sulfotelmatobacter sp.]|nr:ROK family protein [Candidatus Sulfotelmatobacter sp.]